MNDERRDVHRVEVEIVGHLHWAPEDALTIGKILQPRCINTPWLRKYYEALLRPERYYPGPYRDPAVRWYLLHHRHELTVWQLEEVLGVEPCLNLAIERARWLAATSAARVRRWVREERFARLQALVAGRATAGLPLGSIARAYDAALEALQ